MDGRIPPTYPKSIMKSVSIGSRMPCGGMRYAFPPYSPRGFAPRNLSLNPIRTEES